ncbi:hypothetical protein [Micrococcus luteus]|uniref:hypothetical protein n=1 Tax=Micrococcus luteus TaxID=1270 RepID=UPI00366B848D
MNYLSLEWDEVRPLVPNVSDERGQILVEDVLARALGLVPELGDKLTDTQIAVAKAVIRKAVARWADSGSGGVTTKSQTAGPYQTSETYEARGDRPLFYDSEIDELRSLFRVDGEDPNKAKAYSLGPVICATPVNPFDLGW